MIGKSDFKRWDKRKNKIEKHTTYKETNQNVWDNKSKSKEVVNQYWVCDYCRMAINIKDSKNKDQQDGGEFWLPTSIVGSKGPLKLVAHHRCLRKLITEVEKYMEEEQKNGKS